MVLVCPNEPRAKPVPEAGGAAAAPAAPNGDVAAEVNPANGLAAGPDAPNGLPVTGVEERVVGGDEEGDRDGKDKDAGRKREEDVDD